MPKLDEIYYPGKKFVKKTYASALGWEKHENAQFILRRSIVIRVDVNTNNGQSSFIIPPGSLQVKIIGENVSSNDPYSDTLDWYPPLMSIHNIVLPEIGEEVWIMRESSTRKSQGFWISKVQDTDFLSKTLAREVNSDQSPQDRYQFPFKVENIQKPVTQTRKRVFSVPLKPGDVVQQGRSDSFVRHSFDGENNESGVLESGIKERRHYNASNSASIGDTLTKSIHVANTEIQKITGRSLTGEDDIGNVVVNAADIIANVSNKEDSEEILQKLVLGEKQNEWLNKLLDAIDGSINLNLLLTFVLFSHIHTVPAITVNTDTITVSTGPSGETESFNLTVDIPERNTSGPQTLFFDIAAIQGRINDSKVAVQELKTEITNHLSKHQYIN